MCQSHGNGPNGNAAAVLEHASGDAKAQAFAGRLVEVLNGSALALMISLGHRAGLFDALRDAGWVTTRELAGRAGMHERYVREWLGAMTTGRIVEHDAGTQRYRLPAEHAQFLTRAAAPMNLATSFQFVPILGAVEDEVLRAFGDGRGVPYSAYHRFHEVMAEESGQTVVAGLEEHILPLIPGLRGRLERGIDVLDVGCGRGMAMVRLGELFPRSRFHGVDFSEEAIGAGRAQATRRGVGNVSLRVGDVAALPEREAYDLVTAFDAIHDQARPDAVLANVRRALRPGGVFLMQDIKARTAHGDNMDNPVAPWVYTISCMHCMSVSLANNGAGLGAAWGRELAEKMLREAGFSEVSVHELPHDIVNYFYVCPV